MKTTQSVRHRLDRLGWVVGFLALLIPLAGCGDGDASTSTPPAGSSVPSGAIELTFTYGSEKEKWITDVTASFNAQRHKIAGGRFVHVSPIPMGSGESIDELLSGTRQAHLCSPASAAFVKLGNASSRSSLGKDLLGPTDNLVLSPVVIAMWKPMADAVAGPEQAIGWIDIINQSKSPQGWAALGMPQWGRFKFGHTHPEFSNSGLISVLAEVYAAVGKTRGLTLEDLADPKVGTFISEVEQSIIHYGSSTGFFGRKMFEGGPGYLSAAVLYENMVVESYDPSRPLPFPIVALYPREGTFWSDHPVGVVQRDWVTPDHKEAAKLYVQHLLSRDSQQRAMTYGFRPADPQIPLAAPLDAAHGIDPQQPMTTLEVPSPEVTNAVLDLWKKNKKHSNLVLVLDTSGSMKTENRIAGARDGAVALLNMLGDADNLTLLPFSSEMRWAGKDMSLKEQRSFADQTIRALYPDGGTRLYDSIAAAYDHLLQSPSPNKISAVVVLTDGEDTESSMKLDELIAKIRYTAEKPSFRVFTIGYGSAANKAVLQRIADETQGKFYQGTTQNIRDVFRDIATFF